MEEKTSLVPHNCVPHVRTLHYGLHPYSPLRPRHGDNRRKLSGIASHGRSHIPALDMVLIFPRKVIGPRVLPDLVRREVSRPCPTHHPPTRKHRQAIIYFRHWLSESMVTTPANDQRLELYRLLNPLPVAARPLSYSSGLPRNPSRADPFLRPRGVGLRVCKDGLTNLALTFVAALHWVGRLCSYTCRRGHQYNYGGPEWESLSPEEQAEARGVHRERPCAGRAVLYLQRDGVGFNIIGGGLRGRVH